MKRILIVGESSYIGNAFEDYINNADKDEKIGWIVEKVGASRGQWKSVNFGAYDVVLHVAAIVHQKETARNKEEYYKVNRDMAIEVAKKAKSSGVKQFIFMSTMAVFGSTVTCITKDTQPSPTTHYGISKLEAEVEIMKLQEQGSFHVAIVRPPMVYGPGCKGNYARLEKLARIMFVVPTIENKRSVISIDNLMVFIIDLIDHYSDGYHHPQDSEYLSTVHLIRKMREKLNKNTYDIKVYYKLVRYLTNRNSSIKKMFTDLYYEK